MRKYRDIREHLKGRCEEVTKRCDSRQLFREPDG